MLFYDNGNLPFFFSSFWQWPLFIMSHCHFLARLSAVSVNSPRYNRYTIETLLCINEDTDFNAMLNLYLESSIQVNRLMQVHGMLANNGEAETVLGSDMSQVELLGSGSPLGSSISFIYVNILLIMSLGFYRQWLSCYMSWHPCANIRHYWNGWATSRWRGFRLLQDFG